MKLFSEKEGFLILRVEYNKINSVFIIPIFKHQVKMEKLTLPFKVKEGKK
jgi:hypothetical protein